MRMKALLASLLALGLLSVAVASAEPDEKGADDTARRAQVLVKGDGLSITVGEVEDAINQQSPFLRARYQDPEKLEEFVDTMVRFKLLAKEAERRGYADNPAVVRTAKQNAVQQLIRKRFDEEITPKSISDEDVREYYDAHADEFRRPEMVRAAHILLATEKEAKELLPKAKSADMAQFRQLAREHSIDTETRDRGGDLRYFTKEGRPPGSPDAPVDEAIVKAAFALSNVGDVTGSPVKVGEHYSIVKLTGRRPAEERTVEQASQSIRLKLWRERRQQAIEDFVDKLRKKYEPEVHPDRMRPIQLDTAATSPGFPRQGSAAAEDGRKQPPPPAKPAE